MSADCEQVSAVVVVVVWVCVRYFRKSFNSNLWGRGLRGAASWLSPSEKLWLRFPKRYTPPSRSSLQNSEPQWEGPKESHTPWLNSQCEEAVFKMKFKRHNCTSLPDCACHVQYKHWTQSWIQTETTCTFFPLHQQPHKRFSSFTVQPNMCVNWHFKACVSPKQIHRHVSLRSRTTHSKHTRLLVTA